MRPMLRVSHEDNYLNHGIYFPVTKFTRTANLSPISDSHWGENNAQQIKSRGKEGNQSKAVFA